MLALVLLYLGVAPARHPAGTARRCAPCPGRPGTRMVMELVVCRSLWGVEGVWEELFPRLRTEGFTGIETRIPAAPAERERGCSALLHHLNHNIGAFLDLKGPHTLL